MVGPAQGEGAGAVTPLSLGFGAAFLMGLAFGAGPCNIACLPYLGPVFLSGSGRADFLRKVFEIFEA